MVVDVFLASIGEISESTWFSLLNVLAVEQQ